MAAYWPEPSKGYEPRPGQIEMARAVDAAIQNENHLLVEAPTGTGKSIAYSVPAVFHAAHDNKRVLIATANIALQEQLVEKDLPLLERILPWSLSFALLKGRNNYLRRRRCSRVKTDRASKLGRLPDNDAQLGDLLSWAEETDTGDVSELAFQPAKELWRLFSLTTPPFLFRTSTAGTTLMVAAAGVRASSNVSSGFGAMAIRHRRQTRWPQTCSGIPFPSRHTSPHGRPRRRQPGNRDNHRLEPGSRHTRAHVKPYGRYSPRPPFHLSAASPPRPSRASSS